ncbi:MAG: hypothetical protein CSYNP_04504 [Syntrophus sp. SKADARSKE-3]|nr:hypothetical protein [Syntrophus sp. SKADARSKE-3]
MRRIASDDLVDLVEKDDARLLHPFDGRLGDLVHVHQALGLFVFEDFKGFRHLDGPPLLLLREDVAEELLDAHPHLLDAGRRKNLDRRIIHFQPPDVRRACCQQHPAQCAVVGRRSSFISAGVRWSMSHVLLDRLGRQKDVQGFFRQFNATVSAQCFSILMASSSSPDHGLPSRPT